MTYLPDMEVIKSCLFERVLGELSAFSPESFSLSDVRAALEKDWLDAYDFGALLSFAADGCLEDIAVRARVETARYFGNTIRLYTPLYIANYCGNQCTYCAFSSRNDIKRGKLSMDEINRELDAIAKTGVDDVLILTGEAREVSGVEYIGHAVKAATERFGSVGIEIYPLNTDEYAYIHQCGADFVSIYQETYDTDIYDKIHPKGPKRCFPYRFHSQERAVMGGMRGVSFGVLLGLGDAGRDAYAAGLHAYYLQKKYPHIEISLSVPRLRAFNTSSALDTETIAATGASERRLLQIMLAYRLFLPYAGIAISTRERESFRNNVLGLCATKMSAGVNVGVGGYDIDQKGGEQFIISDSRSVEEIHKSIFAKGMQPVYTDHIRV